MEKLIVNGIYKITSPSNRVYVGKSNDIYIRWKKAYQHGIDEPEPTYKRCKNQPLLCNSLKKYGASQHKFEIIEECSISEMNEKEIYYIKTLKTFNSKGGLNLKSGGQGGEWSDESRKKISLTKKGIPNPKIKGSGNWMFGKTHSDEIKSMLSSINKGVNHPFYGKNRSEVTKQKIGEAQKGEKNHMFGKVPHNLGVPHSTEVRAKMKEAAKGKVLSEEHKRKIGLASRRPVIQYTLSGDLVKVWDSVSLAKEATRISQIS